MPWSSGRTRSSTSRHTTSAKKKRNCRKAFPLLRQAAEGWKRPLSISCWLSARAWLGRKRDLKQASKWYERAGKRSHIGALFNLALMYDRGHGFRRNLRKAFALYKRGALEGDREAQVNLAIAYHDGLGTPKNLAQYIRWTKKAATKRDSKEAFNLGLAQFEGDGLPRTTLARISLERAAEKVNKNAVRLLMSHSL